MKFDVLTINTAVELFGILICIIVILCHRFSVVNQHKKVQTDFTLFVLCESLILFFAAAAGLLTGQNTRLADTFLPMCFFTENLFAYLQAGFFTNYVLHSFPSERKMSVHISAWVLILLSAAALVFNLFKPVYYYIDSSDICQISKFYSLSLLPFALIYLKNLFYIIRHRKKVIHSVFVSFIAYMIIPFCASVIQMFLHGIDIVNMALIAVIMLMFVIDRRGTMVSCNELSAVLWEDDSHTNYLKRLRSDLKHTLEKHGCENIILSRKGALGIDVNEISCDYFDYLNKKPDSRELFAVNICLSIHGRKKRLQIS